MAWRQYDWECNGCASPHSDMVWVAHGDDVPDEAQLDCPICGHAMPHRRLVSMPAAYLYDRPYIPIVHGGRFDTAGGRRPPPLPELPKDASMDQARDMFASAEYKEQKADRFAAMQDNLQKKARLAAVQKDGTGIDLRKNPLPGDPPLEGVGKKRKKVEGSPSKRGIAKKVISAYRAR